MRNGNVITENFEKSLIPCKGKSNDRSSKHFQSLYLHLFRLSKTTFKKFHIKTSKASSLTQLNLSKLQQTLIN